MSSSSSSSSTPEEKKKAPPRPSVLLPRALVAKAELDKTCALLAEWRPGSYRDADLSYLKGFAKSTVATAKRYVVAFLGMYDALRDDADNFARICGSLRGVTETSALHFAVIMAGCRRLYDPEATSACDEWEQADWQINNIDAVMAARARERDLAIHLSSDMHRAFIRHFACRFIASESQARHHVWGRQFYASTAAAHEVCQCVQVHRSLHADAVDCYMALRNEFEGCFEDVLQEVYEDALPRELYCIVIALAYGEVEIASVSMDVVKP